MSHAPHKSRNSTTSGQTAGMGTTARVRTGMSLNEAGGGQEKQRPQRGRAGRIILPLPQYLSSKAIKDKAGIELWQSERRAANVKVAGVVSHKGLTDDR